MALPLHPKQNIYYKRARFSTWLPPHYRFTQSHFWLLEQSPGLWRVGFTRFATRMLGDLVEAGFSVQPDLPVTAGQTIGFVEGFKAISDLYCIADGTFAGGNPRLAEDISLVDADEYGEGWLYELRLTAEPNSMDVQEYIRLLDETIDRLRSQSPGLAGEE